jgi:transcriptional regulator with XRE-family HTH domain
MTGKELRRIRRQLGLSQAALAALAGVHPNSIARQERGEMGIREPLARLIHLLAKSPKRGRK